MRKIFIIFTLFMLLAAANEDIVISAGKSIVILPFYDDSGYRGPWQLHNEVPEMLGDMLLDDYFNVISMDTVLAALPKPPEKGMFGKFIDIFRNRKHKQKIMTDLEVLTIARKLNSDYAITGIIEDFKYRRTGGGDVMIGGYKSYTSKVELSHVRVLRVVDGTSLGSVDGEAERNERGLGLELLGKPRKRDLEFYSLDSLDFGSKRFLSSLMGETTVDALNKVQKEIRAIITLPDTSWFTEKKFKVISMDGGIVNINAGSSDGIKPGDIFRVFTPESGVLVGKLRITLVWADHISKSEIIEGKDEIRSGDIIMPER